MSLVMMLLLSASVSESARSMSPPAARSTILVQQVDASRLSLSEPATILEIDLGKLKGTLRRLSWSPDGTQFYIQTAEPDRRLGWKLRHYLVGTDGKPPASVKDEPAWSATYWMWKSAQSAPGVAGMTIGVSQETKRVSATATPMAGNAARGDTISGMGISAEEVGNVTQQSQDVQVFTLTLKGEIVGQFVNTPAIPGLTFGWGQTGSGLVVFSRPDGKLVVMDASGHKQEIASAGEARLPAFTTDGARLAWLEKSGRKKYSLRVADVKVR